MLLRPNHSVSYRQVIEPAIYPCFPKPLFHYSPAYEFLLFLYYVRGIMYMGSSEKDRHMNRKNKNTEETRILEKTLESLEVRRQAPIGVFIVMLALYFVSAVIVSHAAGSQKDVMIGTSSVPVYVFAGIFSSFSKLCIIFMVIFCGKAGFIASVIVMAIQIPMMLMGIFVKGNYTSIPGLFVDALAFIAIIVIFYNKRKPIFKQDKLSRPFFDCISHIWIY